MPKKLVIQLIPNDEPVQIARTLKSYQLEDEKARNSGNPEKFRFLAHSAEVDEIRIYDSELNDYPDMRNVHVFIAEKIE